MSKTKVLIVDDDIAASRLLAIGLEKTGSFQAVTENVATRAPSTAREFKPAVILLDVCMPGLDGVQTLNGLRELDCEVPACFMTAYTGAFEPEDLLRHGIAHVIAKPFHLEELASILRLLTSREPAEFFPSGGVCQD